MIEVTGEVSTFYHTIVYYLPHHAVIWLNGASRVIGERAIAWLEKYVRESRPQLAVELAIEPDDMTVFLTAQGEPFSRDHLTATSKTGSTRRSWARPAPAICSATRWPR
jgi:hypothetical protein